MNELTVKVYAERDGEKKLVAATYFVSDAIAMAKNAQYVTGTRITVEGISETIYERICE